MAHAPLSVKSVWTDLFVRTKSVIQDLEVVNGFVVTFEENNSEDEDYLTKFETCKDKLYMLNALK